MYLQFNIIINYNGIVCVKIIMMVGYRQEEERQISILEQN